MEDITFLLKNELSNGLKLGSLACTIIFEKKYIDLIFELN